MKRITQLVLAMTSSIGLVFIIPATIGTIVLCIAAHDYCPFL